MPWADFIPPALPVLAPLLRWMAKAVSPLLRWMRWAAGLVGRRQGLSDEALATLCDCAESGSIIDMDRDYPLEERVMYQELKNSGYMETRGDYDEYRETTHTYLVVTPVGDARALQEIQRRRLPRQGWFRLPRIRVERRWG